ncbi:MAG: putative aminodeoxychorismate lyase [Parcubacteria bacterium OLB19]|nr:MAG: putative aminodeoxychorismate lyase [Parcubacteria bacterium OLB19]
MALNNQTQKKLKKILVVSTLAVGALLLILLLFLLWTKYVVHSEKTVYVTTPDSSIKIDTETDGLETFPVSVDPVNKKIVEDPTLNSYLENHLSMNDNSKYRQARWFDRILAKLSESSLYQQLASPRSRILVIYPGERREEIVKNFGDILRWNKEQRKTFSDKITKTEPLLEDGKFFPGRYVVDTKITPEAVGDLVNTRFISEILNKYDDTVADKVPLQDALIIASLLEREAYDFTDMRQISGIIWNRLFVEMPLQLDASLQYARGSKVNEPKWWPTPIPADKFLKSPYNTYKNTGLPPTPIANPSVEAVVAALNPEVTPCMFYFHDTKGGFHCTKTYEEHVAKLKKIYGRGI